MKQEKVRKSDLREGMYIVFRNGKGYKVLDGEERGGLGVLLSRTNFCQFYCFLSDDLMSKSSKDYDIMEIYNCKGGKLLYSREEKTAQQIEIEKLEQQIVELSKQVDKLKSIM